MIRNHTLGYDWQAQKRDCPIAADVKPKRKGDEQPAPAKTVTRSGLKPLSVADVLQAGSWGAPGSFMLAAPDASNEPPAGYPHS